MTHLVFKIVINAASLWAAAIFIPGIKYGDWVSLLLTALVFGLVNGLIRPFLKLVSCPVIVLTLGLFTLIINALMLQLTAWFGKQLGIAFTVSGFWPAFFGAIIISVVSTILSFLLPGVRK